MALAEWTPGSRQLHTEGAQRSYHLSHERRRSPEKDPKPLIFVATESQRRVDFIQAAFGLDEPPVALKPGIELNGQDYGIPIVVKKNDDAIRQLPPGVLTDRRAKIVLVASDVRIRICGVENGVCITNARGKTDKIDSVREDFASVIRRNFAGMIRAYRETGTNPYYSLDVATELVTLRGNGTVDRRPMAHTTIIELNPRIVAKIATRSGSERYFQEIEAVLASPYHLRNGDPPMRNIAGLVDFTALSRMEGIESIGQTATAKELAEVEKREPLIIDRRDTNRQIHKGEAGFEEAAQGATFDAIISYIPTALRPLLPDIGQRVVNYQPIQRLNRYGLRQVA